MSPSELPLLHLHSPGGMTDAYVIGNEDALKELIGVLQEALADGEARSAYLYESDVRHYQIRVVLDNRPVDAETWRRAVLPGTEEPALKGETPLWPGAHYSSTGNG
jgi:hypothetical protein